MRVMKVKEFCMFIHSPFATNIHIDAQQVRGLKTVIARQPLSLTEFYILKSLDSMSKQLKTKEDIIKELKQEIKVTSLDVSSVLNNLLKSSPPCVEKTPKPVLKGSTEHQNEGFFKNLQENRVATVVGTKFLKRSSKDFFSITQEGKNKLKNHKDQDYHKEIDPSSEVDIEKENEVTRDALDQFWRAINAEERIGEYRIPKLEESEEDVSFFSDEDRPVLLAIFPFANFCQKLTNPNKPDVHLEFKKNTIYIYPSGVGMFSSQIVVRYPADINEIKNKLELKVKKLIQENFKNQGSEVKLENFNNSIKYGNRFKLIDIDRFEVESPKVNTPAWTHIIYWFYEDEFFEYDKEKGQNLKSDFRKEFTDLLEQPPENTLFLKNRLVFYGWGRSLILTDKLEQSTEKWVRNKVNFVEVGQYSTFGHRLLDYLLQRVLLKLTIEEPVIDRSARNLNKEIEYIDNVRPTATVFLEEFRSGINAILHAGAPFLVKTLESQWRLDKVEESIRNKLESLNKERSAMEQLVITQKQDRMNIISSAFTIMGIASVTAAIVTLSPLKSWLQDETIKVPPFFTLNEILLFIITTIIIIGIAITIIFKWHDIKHWIYRKYNSWNGVRKVKKEIKNLHPKLEEEKEKEKLKQLGIVRRKVKDLFYKKMISKSQYNKLENKINKLENEIKQYMQKIASR
jgi:hypothetical protein